MEGEIVNYINAWLQVIVSLSYCFLIGKLIPPSRYFLRLFLFLPAVSLFLYLPLLLHSVHLGGIFSFFIAWRRPKMEGEIVNYINAWLQVIVSLSYCFLIGKLIPSSRQFLRLFLFLPVVSLFLYLPLLLHSVHLGGIFSFFIAWRRPKMEGEIVNYINAWLQVIVSLSYCFLIGKLIPSSRQFLRLFLFLPVVSLFLYLPLLLHSVHLGGIFSFFIAWLANFKLFLFAFNKGPLSLPSLSLPRFIALASLPIKFRDHNNSSSSSSSSQKGRKSPLNYATKALVLAAIIRSYEYKDHFHPKLLLTLYSVHIYLFPELILAGFAAMGRRLAGVELEPQFNEPYLSSSLQDFWSRRWNIMVTKILRPTVYEPAYSLSIDIMGPKWASLPAVFATFLVSGLVHELMFYYLGRVTPTWEVTWFFILHGLCLTVEIGLKKQLSGTVVQLPRVVSGPLTVGFMLITAFWLFYPQLLQCNGIQRGLQEYATVIASVKNVTRTLRAS